MSTPANTGLHSLATLIKRLEAAASRFEDITDVLDVRLSSGERGSISHSSQGHDSHPSSSYTSPPSAASPSAAHGSAAASGETPKIVSAYQERVIDGKLKPFMEFTKSFASQSVVDAVGLVQKEFDTLGSFLQLVSACQKPDQKKLESLLAPFPGAIEAVSRAKEANRRDRDWIGHLTLLGEGAPVIGWVINPKPVSFVSDLRESVDYYGNRVKKEFKEKDPKHAEWVKMYTAILTEQQAYIKDYHATGLAWNPKGVPVDEYKAPVKTAPSSGGPPPPPPPPPPSAAPPPPAPPAPPAAAPAAAPIGGAAAVFAELNRGADVTKGLRKVDKSEMTHKNPALRASSVVPASTSAPAGRKPVKPSKPSALAGKKPSKFALEGNKWLVEYYENDTITVEETGLSQSINIFGCKNTIIQVKGKVNAVNIINSTKTSVLVHSVVSSISVTASPSFQLQVTGTAPMIQVDSTDSGLIYLSKDSLNAEITTAKCSAINISLPVPGEEDGVFEEQPVPEMFKTVVKDGKLVTSIVEHSG